MDRTLLVPNEHVLDLFLLEQLVVEVEDRAAGVAEDVFDAFFLEAADDDFRTRELHGYALCKIVKPPAPAARGGLQQYAPARFGDGRADQGFTG